MVKMINTISKLWKHRNMVGRVGLFPDGRIHTTSENGEFVHTPIIQWRVSKYNDYTTFPDNVAELKEEVHRAISEYNHEADYYKREKIEVQ